MNNKYKFFWGGVFSNWHPSTFVVNDISYNCAEQYMMYMKAMTFGDTNTAALIMKATHPKEQKKLGRQVKNYDDAKWSAVRYDLVKLGVKEKFLQNPSLKAELLKYKGYILVEASPFDRVWGTGYDEANALKNIDNWGLNLLGKMLTELSNEL